MADRPRMPCPAAIRPIRLSALATSGLLFVAAQAAAGSPGDCGSLALSQEANPSVTKSMVGCYDPPAGSPTYGLSYARLFESPPGGIAVACAEFGVGYCVPGGHPITAHVWINGVEVAASCVVPIPDIDHASEIGAWTATFDQPVVIPGGTAFLLEVRSPSRVPTQGGDGGLFFFGGNQSGESAPTLVKTVECGGPEFVPLLRLNPHATTVVHLLAWGQPAGVGSCQGDLDASGGVDGADLAIVLGAWTTDAGDIDGDGTTDAADLALLLGAWGPCP